MLDSKVCENLNKKFETSFKNLKSLLDDNERLKQLNIETQQQLERELKHVSMLNQEIEVVTKEKAFYEKMYQETLANLNSAKVSHKEELNRLKEHYEAKLKHESNEEMRIAPDADVHRNPYNISYFEKSNENFPLSSQNSGNPYNPVNYKKHLTKLRATLSRTLHENKTLKSKITSLESCVPPENKPNYDISKPLCMVRLFRTTLMESETQTESCLVSDLNQSMKDKEHIEELNSKIETLIFNEIEFQSVIDDLEFKLRCHKKFISSKLS